MRCSGLLIGLAALLLVAACDDDTSVGDGPLGDGKIDVAGRDGGLDRGPPDSTLDHGPSAEMSAPDGAIDAGDAALPDTMPPDTMPPDQVNTASGPVKGTVGTASRVFLGIPYAAPPVGPLRFKPPQPPAPWTQPLNATQFGHICPQTAIAGLAAPPGTESEDCLTLNVWTPYPVPATPAPVMVWIHGGGHVLGATTNPTYDGKNLAEKRGVVFVSFNYRLGPLGWIAHPALGSPSGNYGMMDQQAALKWVKANIAGFGGDPANVTIFGESAGGVSVCTHIASPAASGLFHRAAMQSGTCLTKAPTLAEAEAQGQQLAQAVSCDTAADVAACLRGKSTADLIGALPLKSGVIFGQGVSWGPIIDNALLPDQPLKRVEAGTFNKVPVLLGTNGDEGTLFVVAAKLLLLTQGLYETLVKLTFFPDGNQVLALYPASAYSSPAAALADLLGDGCFVCPTRQTARALSTGGVSTHLYSFTRVPASVSQPFLGCYHGAELPFVFDTPAAPWSTGEGALSAAMTGYWTRMAAAGDPNGAGATAWPSHAQATDAHLQLDLTVAAGAALRKAQCDFWDTILP